MAVLCRLESGGTQYEVRGHGATRRLFSDGVFHSAWNGRTGVTRRAWDLFLPAAFALDPPPARVLVLGVGAGAILLQYRRFLDPVRLVGVELDPVHLELGRRYFGLGQARAEIIQADARQWVASWRGPAFDLVVDDLYGHADGQPRRAVPMDGAWARALTRLVAPAGALVANFISPAELAGSALCRMRRVRKDFACGFRLQVPRDDNAVGLFCRAPLPPGAIRSRLRQVPDLDDRRSACRLRYAIRTLWTSPLRAASSRVGPP